MARTLFIQAIWPYSGHYLPTEDNFKEFISFLEENHVDLSNVKVWSLGDDVIQSQMLVSRRLTIFYFSCIFWQRCTIDDDESSQIKTTNEESKSESTIMIEDGPQSMESVIDASDVRTSIDTSNINATRLDLTRALSCKWTSGVGPRIGCVRDYPMELQSQALEKVNLSPTLNPLPAYSKNDCPIPSPRPRPMAMISPRLSRMGIPSPRASPSVSY